MAIKDYIGKQYIHPYHGRVKVLKKVPKSRTKLEIKEIDKGPGYDPDRKRYVGRKVSRGWFRGQNYQFGHVDETHYKDLT